MAQGIIVDTNVFVKASFDKKKKGADVRVVNDLYYNRMQLIYTARMESELEDVLSKCGPSYFFSKKVVTILRNGKTIDKHPSLYVCADPEDNMFIECAIAAKTPYILTYDRLLRDQNNYEGIKIITPSEFYQTNCSLPKTKLNTNVSLTH